MAVPGSALLVAAALVFLHSHIYWPVGGLAMLAVGVGCGLLAWEETRAVAITVGTQIRT